MEEEQVQKLQMEFSIDEVNVILKALSKEPFKDVFQLIGSINNQAANQLKDHADNDNTQNNN